MTTRAIKQELLDTILPEVYVGAATGSRRRAAVKRERKPKVESGYVKLEPGVDLKRLDVKTLTKKIKKKKKGDYDDAVEYLGSSAPRRPYQWKGRRVRRVLRPGTVVTFSPGQRSSVRAKRAYDEVMGDESLLEDLERGEGEFRYGKRQRYEPLTTSNPTPSLKAVSGQHPIPLPGQAFLLPTVQVMAPRKRRIKDEPDVAFDTKKFIKSEDVKPSGLVEVEDIKVRAPKRVAPGIDVHTVDISVPAPEDVKPPVGRVFAVPRKRKLAPPSAAEVAAAAAEAIKEEPMVVDVATKPSYGPANKIIPTYRKHPSQLVVTPVAARAPRRRRRRTTTVRGRRRRGIVIPDVVYHPSIRLPTRRRRRRSTLAW